MSGLTPDLERLLDQINTLDLAGAALAAQVSDEQFHWHPRGGTAWSIAQCLDHLAVINIAYTLAIRRGVERARERGWARRAPARPGVFGGIFVRSLEPPVRRRLPAPASVQPRVSRDRKQILRDYHAAHDVVRGLIVDCADLDINRATFQNPFVPLLRVKVSTGLHVIPAHDRRHLWQAEQVIRAPDFPRGE
jgi:hypothetical protein